MQLNIVFHDIVSDTNNIKNEYTVAKSYYFKFINLLEKVIREQKTPFSNYHVYFDDGYISFNDYIYPKICDPSKYTLAIVTNDINKNGFLTDNLIKKYDKKGITISSHGVSHASLGFYKKGTVMEIDRKGYYKNSSKGQNRQLCENEILYQFKKSQEYLEKLLHHKIIEFVLPYGIYNNTILEINKKYGLYKNISTCDEYLDDNFYLKPRILISNKNDTNTTIRKILSLEPCFQNNYDKISP